ncbi:conserved hypothetical protein [Anaeromyxobacter sp. K]|uniref:hypothetical protein n=1 Tax=Anaeromyxobacter sp. (strain K) TaxID=447217 RepID=UPI00015FA083|nr:hypothetical protein [Anaeromyxobacter sp. K]ACG73362.1 conserved hypothetical protein [Anaeromyxobacter sp. K]
MPPPRDPRYRPFRLALWALYFTVIAVALAVVLTSIVRNLRGPHRPSATGALPTRAALRVCVTELEALHAEQNHRAWRLADEVGEGDAIARWEIWAREWEQRVDDLADRCRLDARDPDPQGFGGREELAQAREAVLQVHRAYRAQVNRFAQEEADLARRAAQALRRAQEAVSRPPERG